nr:glucan endo-1,3-beta-glucosidase-like [Quercus suber]POE93797.1 glucan endo-1,3-beta-glucosidase [Quercus suber]
MAKLSKSQPKLLPILIFLSLFSLHHSFATTLSIGVNYGTAANNLLPFSQVAHFLETQTIIDRIKTLDANPNIFKAFANTNIFVIVTIENGDVPVVAELPAAKSWVANNILPFHPQTKINLIAVGHEILVTKNDTLIDHLLPAMKALKSALDSVNVTDIHVSTPHSLGILVKSEPSSLGRFRCRYDEVIFALILDFHRKTKSSFMINSYPFFKYIDKTLDYALFKPNDDVLDKVTPNSGLCAVQAKLWTSTLLKLVVVVVVVEQV